MTARPVMDRLAKGPRGSRGASHETCDRVMSQFTSQWDDLKNKILENAKGFCSWAGLALLRASAKRRRRLDLETARTGNGHPPKAAARAKRGQEKQRAKPVSIASGLTRRTGRFPQLVDPRSGLNGAPISPLNSLRHLGQRTVRPTSAAVAPQWHGQSPADDFSGRA